MKRETMKKQEAKELEPVPDDENYQDDFEAENEVVEEVTPNEVDKEDKQEEEEVDADEEEKVENAQMGEWEEDV